MSMSETDTRQVLDALDQALDVFRRYEGRLSAAQIRARSMLSITHSEIAQVLSDAGRDRAGRSGLFVDTTHPA
jgi:hypothetical protein